MKENSGGSFIRDWDVLLKSGPGYKENTNVQKQVEALNRACVSAFSSRHRPGDPSGGSQQPDHLQLGGV